jgi:hypothetical protein
MQPSGLEPTSRFRTPTDAPLARKSPEIAACMGNEPKGGKAGPKHPLQHADSELDARVVDWFSSHSNAAQSLSAWHGRHTTETLRRSLGEGYNDADPPPPRQKAQRLWRGAVTKVLLPGAAAARQLPDATPAAPQDSEPSEPLGRTGGLRMRVVMSAPPETNSVHAAAPELQRSTSLRGTLKATLKGTVGLLSLAIPRTKPAKRIPAADIQLDNPFQGQ